MSDDLRRLVDDLRERVERLEKRGGSEPGTLDFTLLERLEGRQGDRFEGEGVRGALTFAGSVRLGERPYVWQRELAVPEVLAVDPARAGEVFAALGHADRVVLLRRLLLGMASSSDLQSALEATSTGKLYHHLEKLQKAGLIRSAGRGKWEVPPEQVVPALVLLGIAGSRTAG